MAIDLLKAVIESAVLVIARLRNLRSTPDAVARRSALRKDT